MPVTSCSHLDQIEVTELPEKIAGCEECLKIGERLGASAHVHDMREDRLLRLVAEQARDRARRESGHPIIRSAEPGEDWSWCYVDEVAFRVAPEGRFARTKEVRMYEIFTYGRFEVPSENEDAFVAKWSEFATWVSTDPMTATVLPVRTSGGFAVTQPSSNAFSMMDTSMDLIVTGSSLMPSTHEPSHGAGTQTAGELREIVRRVQPLDRRLPAIAVDEIVPVGNQIAQRASLMAERDAAVHAPRALLPQLLLRIRQIHFVPVLQPLGHRTGRRLLAMNFDEACWFTHKIQTEDQKIRNSFQKILLSPSLLLDRSDELCKLGLAILRARFRFCEHAPACKSCGITFTNG